MEIDGLGISKDANAAQTAAAKTFTKFMSSDPAAQCHVRGGDMQSTATTSTCDYGTGVAVVARNVAQPTVGFRCCSAQ